MITMNRWIAALASTANVCARCSLKLSNMKRGICSVATSKLCNENSRIRRQKFYPLLQSSRCHGNRPVVDHTMDEEELKKFRALAQSWWDETGEFEALHAMNRIRVPFIRDALQNQREDLPEDFSLPLQGLSIVDAGSGGGLLAEPLARLGAFVVGVEPVEESTKVAQLHLAEDPALLPRLKYITGTVEDLVGTEAGKFDAVVASEVVEHVSDLLTFVESCCKLVKPGGSLFFTTLNRTQWSKCLAVYGAEKIVKVVPEGTHDWEKFIPPQDLQRLLESYDVHTRVIHGMFYNPLTRHWSWVNNTEINYAIHAIKGHEEETSTAGESDQ